MQIHCPIFNPNRSLEKNFLSFPNDRLGFKATITPEQLDQLRQLIDHSIESWTSVLANHRAEQSRFITEHESNMHKTLGQDEGVLVLRFLDESLGDILARLYAGIGTGGVLRNFKYNI